MTGRQIAHYEILDKLGEGGMGVVYKARDGTLNRIVALKFLPARLIESEEQVARFEQEARAISALNHPHIATIYALEQVDGDRFLVLEYLPGGTLKDRMRRSKLSPAETIDFALQIAGGLAHAHRRGIIHRDLKTENVMLAEEGSAKITDFGLAKLLDGEELTATGNMLGTASYVSPEQAQGQSVDHRSDIFSFGVVLYEMLTGELPFRGASALATLLEVMNKPTPALGGEIGALVGRALEKNRDARYQSMDEVVAELRRIARGSTLSFSAPPRAATPPATVAVLPFANLSANPENEYFSDGLAEDLITALSQLEGLRVVARTSAFQFKGKSHDVREIGRQLSVGAVVEGSVRRAGDKVRVTAQLVNVADGFQLWSERFDRDMKDVFAIQDEISHAIVKALRVRLVGGEARPLARHYTENLEAYNLLLKGRYHWNKWNEDGFRKGIELYGQAIATDPRYAPAYAGLADCLTLLGFWGLAPPGQVMPQAKGLATKALEMDEALADVHSSLATVASLYDWDLKTAEREFRRAIELNPGYATAHLMYGMTCLVPQARFDEGVAEVRRALELDPLSLVVSTYVGVALWLARRHDEAIEQLRRTIELDPAFSEAHRCLAWVYVTKGRIPEAMEAVGKARELSGDTPIIIADLAFLHARSGQRKQAQEYLEQLTALSQASYVSGHTFALVYSGLGDLDRAFEWWERCYEERQGWMLLLKVGPVLDLLRSDPRLAALQKKVGLE